MTKKVIRTEEQKKSFNSGTLVIYAGSKGGVELRADTDKETIWATQTQIAELFEIDRTVATKHINNVFRDREIDEKSNVQKMHIPNSDKPITLYSLDIILAVGYRTNSAKAVKFRQWATRTLREYLIKGIVVNTERIKKLPDRILHDIIGKFEFIQRTLQNRELNKGESDSLLAVIHDYANSWLFLKDHPFSDGNKRIGSFLFVYFLDANKLLYRPDGEKKINDNTLVALALLIAESDPKDKEVMVVLVTNLLV